MLIALLRKYFLVLAAVVIISCDDDSEPPSLTFELEVLAYDETTKEFQLTPATLLVTSENQTVLTKELAAETSVIAVPEKEGSYTIKVTKAEHLPFEKKFTADELVQFNGSPLVVTLLYESITEGLVVFYPFNGNGNDSTSNNRDGAVHGATLTNDRKGKGNSSYYFDGQDDYISVAHHSSLNPTGDFAISLWTLVASTQVPHEGINDILRKWNGNAEGYPFSISYLNTLADDANEDKFIYVRYDGQGCANAPTSYSPTIDNDEFLHIVLVKQGTKLRHYLNGSLIQEFTDNTSCSTANTADMTIGCRGNLVRFFKGKIDDVRIYNRSISDAEVANLFVE
jgi:hypothetical protein